MWVVSLMPLSLYSRCLLPLGTETQLPGCPAGSRSAWSRFNSRVREAASDAKEYNEVKLKFDLLFNSKMHIRMQNVLQIKAEMLDVGWLYFRYHCLYCVSVCTCRVVGKRRAKIALTHHKDILDSRKITPSFLILALYIAHTSSALPQETGLHPISIAWMGPSACLYAAESKNVSCKWRNRTRVVGFPVHSPVVTTVLAPHCSQGCHKLFSWHYYVFR
jgi:hypothetical protein